MQRKTVKYTFRGMNQDVTEGKHPNEFFYEANNIRFLTTEETITGGVAFEKGNELSFTLPDITIDQANSVINLSNNTFVKYKNSNEIDTQLNSGILPTTSNSQVITGHATTRNSIILFSTDDLGMDCIWEINIDTFKITLLYLRNLSFSTENPIQCIFNYENDNIQKIYWVDGTNQIRFLNIRHSIENGYNEELINVNSNTINIVGNFNISQPYVSDIVSGGTHTAGVIQYAYNLYRLNSSQTKLSPLSDTVSLDKGLNQGGGAVNEIVGSTPIIKIENIDPEYTNIKVYAVKYTSYNQLPSISVIADQEVPSTRNLSIFDDGNIEEEISLEEFLFLGSDPIIPSHIESKDNYLFSGNIKDRSFDIDLDTRAYSFGLNDTNTFIYDNLGITSGVMTGTSYTVSSNFIVPKKHDSINRQYDIRRYQFNSNKLGGEGKYLKYEIVQDSNVKDPERKQFFKDNEVYRLGIQFYNRLGQKSLPKWIADYKMPEGNLQGNYNTLKVTLKSDFYVWLNDPDNFESEDDKPVGYKVLRANRTQNDKTIITQGVLNGMISNFRADDKSKEFSEQARYRAEKGVKMPSLQRTFGKHHTQMEGAKHYLKLDSFDGRDDQREVHKASSSQNWIAETFQFNSLMQMYSPEVLFGNVSLYNGLKLRVKGAFKSAETKFWGQSRVHTTKEIVLDGKVLNGLTPHDDISFANTGETQITGNINELANYGIFGPASKYNENAEMDFYQFYRNFTGTYYPSSTTKQYDVYGKPELAIKGQEGTNYNNDPDFKYHNSLQPMIADGGDGRDENSPAITSVNSWAINNLTFVLGSPAVSLRSRTKLEDLWSQANIAEDDVALVAEFVKNDQQIYLGGIYGGNSFEDKKRTKYLEIGSYSKIDTDNISIDSPGDTFVQNFRYSKLIKTDTEVYSISSLQVTEIVECKIESTIDLMNRNDISHSGWDSRFQPRDSEYHEYNRVYSQQPTVVLEQNLDYNFRRIKNFDTRIISSKVKTPGELIDSWTDLLVNEVQDLNGRYGPINGMCSFKDNIYAFQDNALAFISINPRVQTQGSDGIAVELGTGGILHDYEYLSTKSGCINKWGIQVSNNAIYYLDGLNKSMFRFTGKGLEGLSSLRGLHKYLLNELKLDDLEVDNPILGQGVSMGYDLLNNDIYLTYNNQWTLCFNEKMDQYTGFYSYNSPMYIYAREKMLSINPNLKRSMYQFHKGDYNTFYGNDELSNIIFIANPEPDHECVFNNLEYKSVALDENKNETRYTWDSIRAYNEYQDSGYRSLDNNNIRKLNRKYRLAIPRNQNSTDRIRNNWAFIELVGNNNNKYFYVNQDILLHYTSNHIIIQ